MKKLLKRNKIVIPRFLHFFRQSLLSRRYYNERGSPKQKTVIFYFLNFSTKDYPFDDGTQI